MNKNLNVGIIGAGIQGISNALFLQKKGFKVTIFDREKPGSPVASYGNAGHFSPYASLSLNRKDILKLIWNAQNRRYKPDKNLKKLNINSFIKTLISKYSRITTKLI